MTIRICTIRPSTTSSHSAPGASATSVVSVSYISTAVVSSPNAASSSDDVSMCANGSMNARKAAAPTSRPVGAAQTMSSAT